MFLPAVNCDIKNIIKHKKRYNPVVEQEGEMDDKKSLSLKEKAAYGLGAVGKDMVYMLSASYVLYYFQDIMGVNTIAMGIILLIARVFDAFNDPIMGVVVAKTKTRWGKFRPWLLIGTITNAILLVLMFAAPPSLNGGGLIAYAAVTYIMWGVTYTMMDIPYWSMVPAFTNSGKEREGLSALARSCAGVGSALITIITVMAVSALGGRADARNTDTITKAFDRSNTEFAYYIVANDADGNPTSEKTEVTEGDILINISGVERAFEGNIDEATKEHYLSFTNSNTDYTVQIGDWKSDKSSGDNSIEIAMDSVDSGKAAIVIYVNKDTYNSLTSAGFYDTSIEMHSTLEVERLGFRGFSIIVAILFILFTVVTCICIKEKSTVDMETVGIGEMFKALVRNDQAMTIVITIVLINTALYITSNLLIYYFKYDMGGSNWQGNYTLFNTFAGGMQILAMMLLFPLLRRAFSTLKIFYICVFAEIIGYIILLGMALLGVPSVLPLFAPGFLIMAGVGILNVVVTVFLANTVDYGELKNYRRDESVIFSMQTFVVKLGSGIAALVASICLSVFNIQNDGAMNYQALIDKVGELGNTSSLGGGALIGLRMVMTIGPTLLLIIAFLVFRAKYILTDDKLEEISNELKKR